MHGTWWVVNRELRARVEHGSAYAGCAYEGPVPPLVLLGGAGGLFTWVHGWDPEPLAFFLGWLYWVYLAYAAARLGASALASEESLPALQPGAGPLLFGKLAVALLPLWIEILALSPVGVVLCWRVELGLYPCVAYLAAIWVVVLWYGLLGLFWAFRSESSAHAVFRARWVVHWTMWILPIVAVPVGSVLGRGIGAGVCALNPILLTQLLDPRFDGWMGPSMALVGWMVLLPTYLVVDTLKRIRRGYI